MATRLVDRATPGTPADGLDCDDAWGLYLSTPGGMLIWMGMYPFPPLPPPLLLPPVAARPVVGRDSADRGLVFPNDGMVGETRAKRAMRLGALAFFLGCWRACFCEMAKGTGSTSGGGGTLRRKSTRLSSCGGARLGRRGPRSSSSASSSLKSRAYGSLTRRVLRLGIMSPSSNMLGLGCLPPPPPPTLSFLMRALDEFIELSVMFVEAPLYRMSGSIASTALPPTAPDSWSESIVVRNGATVRGMRGLPALGGPRRMKSMRSELSSL